MTTITTPSTSFWPSRRLWMKLVLSFLYAPFLLSIGFVLLVTVFAAGIVAGGMSMMGEGSFTVLGSCLVLLGLGFIASGPILLGMLLSRFWRGLAAGGLALVSMTIAWTTVGYLTNTPSELLSEALTFSVIASIGISVIEIVTQDVHEARGMLGLGVGLVIGFLCSLIYAYLFSPYQAKVNFSKDVGDLLFIVAWSSHFALIWISSLFFPELFSRRVSLGGVIVWSAFVTSVFVISSLFFK